MIDENKDYDTKSKLTITAKKLSKTNVRSKVAPKQENKQTHRHRNWQNLGRKTKTHTYIYTHKQTYKWSHVQREVNKK